MPFPSAGAATPRLLSDDEPKLVRTCEGKEVKKDILVKGGGSMRGAQGCEVISGPPYARPSSTNNGSDTRGPEPGPTAFQHPVKLHWSKPVYDYMYQYGKQLLDAFPVQATICIVDQDPAESDDSDFESDYEDDSDADEKPLKRKAPTLN
uniref:Protein ripply n=1 Tax=Branchiostoma floridae TaxID=7739 RepID=C3XTH1_BRAFL|eukprot:XP_002612588.1 hypothetical protein BRAFLDRAFT_78786 [Branchiostoma floridae]